ncbi:MAG TPA: heme biosynthesis HemY N-terminal domain-containing protein [Stellaceae bacterium]|jgi:HemY protein|nr:heme biosynthesis HemY N-terminal domain-containing protein [Stellaceae bacterium]
MLRLLIILCRVVVALLLLAIVGGGAVFFSDRPGQVEITWQGWQIDTSVGVLAAGVVAVALLASLVALLLAALRRVPRNLRRRRARLRREAGDRALTRGLVALAAGQAAPARVEAQNAELLIPGHPVALLLAAEAAQRDGDTAQAQRAYAALLERRETEFLGLRGLIGQTLRAGDDDAALRLAERARRVRPDARWLIETLLVLEARAGAWDAARETLAAATRRGALSEDRAQHHHGVLLYELSSAAEQRGELRHAARLAAKAQRLAPDIAAVAYHRARLLLALGRRRAATKAIEHAWRTAPHPDLARLYLEVRPLDGPLARAAALPRLAQQNPHAAESHQSIAEVALAAQLWGEARRHLELAAAAAPPGQGPSRQLCLLMARLEESESGNARAAREWVDRAVGAPPDAAYICERCGEATPDWHVLCRRCDGFDTLSWRRPPPGQRPFADSPDATAILPAPATLHAATISHATSGLAAPAQSDN